MRGYWLLGVSLGATLISAATAHAGTCTPHSDLLWSYPNATTEVVPTDAVFRAFGYPGGPLASTTRPIVLELDGREVPSSAAELEVDVSSQYTDDNIEFLRRYQHPLESSEFVPPEPLSPGEHEVVFRVLGYVFESDSYETVASYRFTVRAEEQTRPTSDVTISAVTAYIKRFLHDDGIPQSYYPPPEALEGVCERTAKVDADDCSGFGGYWTGLPRLDLIDSGAATRVEIPLGTPFEARVDLATSGPALGYLIDSQFVLEGCSAAMDGGTGVRWDEQRSGPAAVSFYVQAVLPTGLGPPHGFTGDVPIIEVVRTYDFQETNSSLCSVGAAGAHTSRRDLSALALFVASATVFRRRKQRSRVRT
jgi:hypothetical protein